MRTITELLRLMLDQHNPACSDHPDGHYDMDPCPACYALRDLHAEAREVLTIATADQQPKWAGQCYTEGEWRTWSGPYLREARARLGYSRIRTSAARSHHSNPCRLVRITTVVVTETIEQEGEVTT